MNISTNVQSDTGNSSLGDCPDSRTAKQYHRWLLAALIVGTLLRIHCLVYPYLWLDEYVTLWSIGGDTYGEMLERAMRWTASGPLFVLCYRASCDLVSNVDLGLKLPGVILGSFGIWAAWWTARQLFQRTDVAVAAAWLVALAPQFIHFSQEARPYMAGGLLVLLSTGFLQRWLRDHSTLWLAALIGCSLAAVGFHLLAALAIVAQNAFVFVYAALNRWPLRRWLEWSGGQLALATGLYFVGVQFRMLSGRHSSMILETSLAMPTRLSLDQSVWGQLQVELTIIVLGLALWWYVRRFPQAIMGRAWHEHRSAILLAAIGYVLPTLLLTILSVLRVIDCWARYYFLFHAGFMLMLAWLVVCAFPKSLSRCLFAAVVVGMLSQFNFVGGIPSCRLNGRWVDFGEAGAALRQRIGPDDLVLSRSGLIEANHLRFLSDPIGASYLKAFLEAKDGALAATHLPLPFTPESSETKQYLAAVFQDAVLNRQDFWLVNLGTPDFDYDDWIASQFGNRIRKVEQFDYPALSVYHYALTDDASASEKKGTPDWVPATFSKVPCQRSI